MIQSPQRRHVGPRPHCRAAVHTDRAQGCHANSLLQRCDHTASSRSTRRGSCCTSTGRRSCQTRSTRAWPPSFRWSHRTPTSAVRACVAPRGAAHVFSAHWGHGGGGRAAGRRAAVPGPRHSAVCACIRTVLLLMRRRTGGAFTSFAHTLGKMVHATFENILLAISIESAPAVLAGLFKVRLRLSLRL